MNFYELIINKLFQTDYDGSLEGYEYFWGTYGHSMRERAGVGGLFPLKCNPSEVMNNKILIQFLLDPVCNQQKNKLPS